MPEEALVKSTKRIDIDWTKNSGKKRVFSETYPVITDLSMFLDKAKNEFELMYKKKVLASGSINDYERVKTLGTGSFGQVILVKKKDTDVYHAVKVLHKQKVVKLKQVEHSLNEMKILRSINFPFVVNMEKFHKDNSYIYFVMPFIQGGELFTHLHRLGRFDESLAKFYAAQVILALEYLHHLNLVYRDLKPENIVIDRCGYLKITDFGFCKLINGRTWTLCGTPEYLAPEIILSKGYGKSADWWAVGVLIFEINAGYPPFCSQDPMKIYEKVVAGKYRNAPHFSNELRDLIRNILQVDLSRRYGILKNGVNDFKNHKWFKHINWMAILNRRLEPPYIPKLKGINDTSNFDNYEEESFHITSFEEYAKEFANF
ncbi:unnamed protein product [Timema podura]|uniref:cAMP-dependent protein kinase n=1 Tax=Timema podura TaxID=61482 RepID=A0ABN7P167_TIMPD|nr:unnamed protein product [Timema podura]